MSTIEATPIKKKIDSAKKTPRSDRKSETKVKEERHEVVKKTPLFKKIRKQKQTFQRTIYHG